VQWEAGPWGTKTSAGKQLLGLVANDVGQTNLVAGPDTSVQSRGYEFPPMDLIPVLVDAYFDFVNVTAPLLHRPTFARALAQDSHHVDGGFGALLLLVCAIGARYVDDVRVLIDGGPTYSAGWKWFNQARTVSCSMLVPPSLLDLQMICVSTQRSLATFTPMHADILECPAFCHVSPRLVCTTSVLEPHWNRHPVCSGHWCASQEGVQRETNSERRALEARVLVCAWM
jgi:hypothetical protein